MLSSLLFASSSHRVSARSNTALQRRAIACNFQFNLPLVDPSTWSAATFFSGGVARRRMYCSIGSPDPCRRARQVEQNADYSSRAEHSTNLEPTRANPKQRPSAGAEQQYVRETKQRQHHDQQAELGPHLVERKHDTYTDPDNEQKGGPCDLSGARKLRLQKEPKSGEPQDACANYDRDSDPWFDHVIAGGNDSTDRGLMPRFSRDKSRSSCVLQAVEWNRLLCCAL